MPDPFSGHTEHSGSGTSIVRSREDTMPEVTVGPPSSASAYPIATTCWPRRRPSLEPSGTVVRPFACTFRTARSCSQSPPITRAPYRVGSSSDVETVMRDAPCTTWQLVTTTPLDRTMKPVPIPSPCSGAPVEDAWYTFVVTLTTEGSTLEATAAYGSDPASRGGTGEIGVVGV